MQSKGHDIPMQEVPLGGGNPVAYTVQPGYQAPPRPANCPPGLEYLLQVDQLLIKQKVELLEAVTGFETENKYEVFNSLGQRVFYVHEQSGCCTRLCCGSMRSFHLNIQDNAMRPCMIVERKWRPCSKMFCCCCQSCLQEIKVYAPRDHLIGTVLQHWTCCKPEFDVHDASGEKVLEIKGPFWQCSCAGDVEYKVYTNNDQQCGLITKQFSGVVKEMFTDADNFGVSFPIDLDVNVKATLLAAVFLIDFMFFEDSGDKKADSAGRF